MTIQAPTNEIFCIQYIAENGDNVLSTRLVSRHNAELHASAMRRRKRILRYELKEVIELDDDFDITPTLQPAAPIKPTIRKIRLTKPK